jgi:ribosome-associated translation inhibitor RaiA
MNIDWRNHVTDEETDFDVRDLVERRLQRVLRFFPQRITAVRVYVNDINGTRGGIDKQVRIQVYGSLFGEVVATATGLTLHAAASEAVLKTGSAVHRVLHRRRTRRLRARRSAVRSLHELGQASAFQVLDADPERENDTVANDRQFAMATT